MLTEGEKKHLSGLGTGLSLMKEEYIIAYYTYILSGRHSATDIGVSGVSFHKHQ